ncbi:MAG: methylmalonyl-CoA epimerase [Candidatus Latescibacterota bacterium]|nr:MAG: methylmalonyl-CoA epimerase [Candidatus Latescibacterota bacterium]
MIRTIDHIAIAVADLDEAVELYEKTLGLRVTHREHVDSFNVDIATFEIGGTAIELLEGKSDDSAVRKFVETRGPGLHHIAFVVDDIEKSLATLRAQGVRLIDETPRRGKEDTLVAFIHPKSTQKVLYELVQLNKKR